MIDKRGENLFLSSQERAEWFKYPWQSGDTHQGSPSITNRGTVPHTQQLEVLWKSA